MGKEGLPVRPIELADLVEYQDGAVVSRTLVKSNGGTVTVFAFDRGQELSEHTVPHDALVHVVDGEVEIRLGGAPHRLGPGQLLLMPGGTPHAVKALDRFKMVLVLLRG